jgi:hypothetical protein
MYRVTVIDTLSGDVEPQCIDTFETFKEARELAALHMEDAATYDESGTQRAAFEYSAKMFRSGYATDRTVDGFHVFIERIER